jgi:hypothetical protein
MRLRKVKSTPSRLLRQKRYREKNREKIQEYQREYAQKNRKKINAQFQKWRDANLIKYRALVRKSYAKNRKKKK